MTTQSDTLPAIGARFQLNRPVERFPHFRAQAGAAGTVVDASSNAISLHMDDYLPGAEDWDNEIVWTQDDDYDETGIRRVPSTVSAFSRDVVPASEPLIPTDAQTPAQANAQHFERWPDEGSYLLPAGATETDADGEALRYDVHHRGAFIGCVAYHRAPDAPGSASVSRWHAHTDDLYVTRTQSGIGFKPEPTAGEQTREAAVALLVAAHLTNASIGAPSAGWR